MRFRDLCSISTVFLALLGPWTTAQVPASAKACPGDDEDCSLVHVQLTRDHSTEVLQIPATLDMQNRILRLDFMCIANEPTEWTYDWDPEAENYSPWRRMRHRGAKYGTGSAPFHGAINVYWARLNIRFEEFQFDEILHCRAVANHSNNVQVLLTSRPTVGASKIVVTQTRDVAVAPLPESIRNSSDCPVVLEVREDTHGYFVRCSGSAHGHRPNWIVNKMPACYTSPQCASTFRSIKLPVSCIARYHNMTSTRFPYLAGWKPLQNDGHVPGVVECRSYGNRITERAAFEYFFDGAQMQGIPVLHFSLSEIDMRDWIWFDFHSKNVTLYYYYDRSDTFGTQCHISQYGFAEDWRVDVTLNGSIPIQIDAIEWRDGRKDNTHISSKIILRLAEHGPGSYEILCLARVWNTTERVNRTMHVQVITGVKPYFEESLESVAYDEEEEYVRLVCDAHGVPPPQISWGDLDILPGASVIDGHLLFPNNKSMMSPITCTGVNRFGKATKVFIWEREEKMSSRQVDGSTSLESNGGDTRTRLSLSTTVVIILAVVASILATVFLGLVVGYLHLRFEKSGPGLSPEEIQSFLDGDEPPEYLSVDDGDGDGDDDSDSNPNEVNPAGDSHDRQSLLMYCLPYNAEYEVPESYIVVNLKRELGSGQYGIVYEGTLRGEPVAYKMVRPDAPKEYFKALMSELKILAFLGHHENIVNLIGTNTSKIGTLQLYVGVELCKESLLQHLQRCRQGLMDTDIDNEQSSSLSAHANLETQFKHTLDVLPRWAAEIAAGNEYLAQKRLMHRDLAARNVLLTFDMHAKICDFGLSRLLINYEYKMSNKRYLPWKWMALESLVEGHFSTQSDVWAFGITCWEMYSLGNIPYAGVAYNKSFVEELDRGERLGKPKYASHEIYGMMLKCWHARRRDRPSFRELKQFFKEQEDSRTTAVAV